MVVFWLWVFNRVFLKSALGPCYFSLGNLKTAEWHVNLKADTTGKKYRGIEVLFLRNILGFKTIIERNDGWYVDSIKIRQDKKTNIWPLCEADVYFIVRILEIDLLG